MVLTATTSGPAAAVGLARPASRCQAAAPKACNQRVAASAHSGDEAAAHTSAPHVSRRGTLAAVMTLAAAVALQPREAVAAEEVGADGAAAGSGTAAAAADAPQTIYFGNGCFWGRQHDFVETERAMGRKPEEVSSTVGYAGGRATGPDGRVCYYYGPGNSVYEKLGHAEVVQLELMPSQAEQELMMLADKYFSQFRKTPFGMMRLDPQDAGPGYRNVIGLPGGVSSPLFRVLQERNVNNMELKAGDGNSPQNKNQEEDRFNTVWVLDSNELPFYRAEVYHQFHDGIGVPFPPDYKVAQRAAAEKSGRIGPTNCPEGSFFFGV